jgi:S1-C subfamily serine protease
MESNLAQLSNELENAIERAAPYVVGVHGRGHVSSSGFLFREGVVVTAHHALRREEDIRVTLPSGETVDAALAGGDGASDIAVLRIDSKTLPLSAARASNLRPGQIVLSLGRSRDSGINASMGILSAVSGEWRPWRGGRLESYLRLDLTLFPASAGGPVLTPAGELVGMATPVLSRIAPLAVPHAAIQRIADDLLSKGRVARGYLGVGLQPVPIPDHLKQSLGHEGGSAVIVLSVEPGSPAEKGGVVIGDVLLSIDGHNLRSVEDLHGALDSRLIGKTVKVKLARAGQPKDVEITVGERGAQ